MLIRSGALAIVVIDSVAALVPKSEIEGDMGDSHVGAQARLMSQALRKMTGIANKTGVGHVTVTISRQRRDGADGVLVGVSDDGVGRAEAAQAGGPSTKQGLKILGQQLDLYNRTNRHHIQQHVTDLTDNQGHPAGTCFETWVPIDFKY